MLESEKVDVSTGQFRYPDSGVDCVGIGLHRDKYFTNVLPPPPQLSPLVAQTVRAATMTSDVHASETGLARCE